MSYKYSTGSVYRGDIYFEDDRDGAATYIDFGQDTITLRPSGSQILHATATSVGIGTTTPDYTLDVAGDIGVDQYIYHNGDADTYINFLDDKIVLKAGNKSMITVEEKNSAPHEVTINDGGNNVDFVVKGNGSGEGNPAFKVDGSTNKVGINGVGTPDEALHVDGNIKVVGDDPRINIDGDTDSHPGLELSENGTRKWIIYNNYVNDNLTFKTNNDIRVSIEQDGNVGIANQSPKTALDVHHNPTSLANDTGGGEVVTFGTGNLTAGKLYFLNSSGAWTETDADAIATSDGLLGIALGSAPSNGVLLRGFFDATTYLSNFISGLPVYLSTTAANMDTTQPSGTADIVRCVGYCTNTANVIYFNPSSTTIELA